jgi:molybdopterin-guanine dinucleotide biosynthesis protein A
MDVSLSVAIQAGGQSTRMGRDKGLLPFGEVSLVEYIFRQIQGVGGDSFIVSNRPRDYAFLGIPVYSDVYKNVGALGGMHTILNYLSRDYVLVLACDMPFINMDFIDYMIDICKQGDVVIPSLGEKGFLEPFRAIYSKGCLESVESAISKGKRKVISFLKDVKVFEVSKEEIHRFDPEETTFMNINSERDYQRGLETAKMFR